MGAAIAVMSHGPLAQAMIETAGMISGVDRDIQVFSLVPGQDIAELRADVERFAREHGEDGCLLLADLFGGTPCNIAAACSMLPGVEIVSGLNLPMLVEVVTRRDQLSLTELRDAAIEAASSGVIDVKGRFMAARKQREDEF